uniref:Uncharacterized protein n=1 Tax=Lotharella oceanica TaxID=641309 RepID=A0A7S2XEX3_9EUKA|mmetsp:Transcript_35623/g.66016  ORF Transcript_35623/g.66016 Transcript_35623/m.66016 type:complete len:313 (+) Transcript_35623:122-1060(+)
MQRPKTPGKRLGRRPPWREFLYGGLASCCAEAMTMPLDVVKVRMQIQGQQGMNVAYKGFFQTGFNLLSKEGIFAFWTGTTPAILRQGTYGTLRIGLYVQAKRVLGIEQGSTSANPGRTIVAGVTSGGFSSAVCTPTDLIKVRMQAGYLRGSDTPTYRGVLHAAQSIVAEEGWLGLYRGVGPTTARAAIVAAAELGSYDEIKMFFKRNGAEDGVRLHLLTAALAGFCATAASSPFDVVKSRVMSQPLDEHGRGVRYSGMFDCFQKSIRTEGISFMWRGFSANYLNKGPTVVLFFVLYEAVQTNLDDIFDSYDH